MAFDDTDYHTRRAATERRLAERSNDPAAALAHLTLSHLHGERAEKVRAPSARQSVAQGAPSQ